MSRKHLPTILKAAVSIALIWYLIDHVELGPIFARLSAFGPFDVVAPLAAFAMMTVSAAQRWRMVARPIGSPLSFATALRIYLVGTFFNQTLPSAIGGDAVRVWMVSRLGHSLGRSFSVVACERAIGLLALVLIVGATLPMLWKLVPDAAARWSLSALVAVALSGAGLVLIFGDGLMRPLSRLPFSRSLAHLASDFRIAVLGQGSGLPMILLSVAIHLFNVAIVVQLAHGLDLSIGFFDCLVLMPPVVLLTMLPISIAGWGVREGAMVVAFGYAGVAPADAVALSLLHGFVYLLGGLPGGVLWLGDVRRPSLATITGEADPGSESA